jgi:1-aminocyclopropane-1-carboxylate deaminase
VLRTDLIDPLISGNKFYKLKYNLASATAGGHKTLLSFGGAWSNHLHALSAAGQRHGFQTIGVVRGTAPAVLNACLADAVAHGMQLHFVTREEYRGKHSPEFMAGLHQRFGDFYAIPEGGANLAGIRGCQEILSEARASRFSQILLACGTGTTMAGLVTALSIPILGIQVLKGAGYLQQQLQALLALHGMQARAPWQVIDDRHRGGYGKVDAELLAFTERLSDESGILFEPVYTGKVMMALQELISVGHFPPGAHLLVIHGGGIQGLRGFK